MFNYKSWQKGTAIGEDAVDHRVSEDEDEKDDKSLFEVNRTYSEHGGSSPDLTLNRQWHSLESQRSMAMSMIVRRDGERWSNWCEFFWTATASSVGLGNIWRFSFVAAEHGGGAFLIPYLMIVCFIGYPMLNLELGLGQFTSQGPYRLWEMIPIFKGIGIVMMIINFLTGSFYTVILSRCLHYWVYSFYPNFPWDGDGKFTKNRTHEDVTNEFYKHEFLGIPKKDNKDLEFYKGTGLDGPPQWHLVLGLVGAWILWWLVTVGGVRSYGKIAYFLGIFPFVNLLLLVGASWALEGAGAGILYLFTPQWSQLFRFDTWYQAATQCFFSLNIGFGSCILVSSYREFNHDINLDAMLIIIMDTTASILAGMSLFAVMGNTAFNTGKSIKDIAKEGGEGLAFVTYPHAIRSFGDYPGPQFFAVSFFFMLIVLSIGSGNSLLDVVASGLCDLFPTWNKTLVITGVCILCFGGGLVYCCPDGSKVIEIVDAHGVSIELYLIVFFEAICVFWVYGLKNISNDLEFMLGERVSMIKMFCWGFVIPVSMIVLFIGKLQKYIFRSDSDWPLLATLFGWCMTSSIILVVPVTALIVIHQRKSRHLKKRIKASFRPTTRWGPKDSVIYKAWRKWKTDRPSEFEWTSKLLYRLGMRDSINSYHANSIWSDRASTYSVDDGNLTQRNTLTTSTTDIQGGPTTKADPLPEIKVTSQDNLKIPTDGKKPSLPKIQVV